MSDTAPAPADAPADLPEGNDDQPETDWKAEAEKWRTQSREQEKRAKANAKAAAELDELKAADKTELEKLTEKATAAEQRAAELEKANLRSKVALAKGLTGEKSALADRLHGDTEEELAADADALLAMFSPGRPSGDAGGGNRGTPVSGGTSMDDLIRNAAGRS